MQVVSTVPVTPSEVVMAAAALFSMALNWRFAASISQMKLDIKTESEKLRNEILGKLEGFRGEFQPGQLANEQRSSLLHRVEIVELEVSKNRERIHLLANDAQKIALDLGSRLEGVLLGPVQNHSTMLTDKARRMASMEERMRSLEENQHDMQSMLDRRQA